MPYYAPPPSPRFRGWGRDKEPPPISPYIPPPLPPAWVGGWGGGTWQKPYQYPITRSTEALAVRGVHPVAGVPAAAGTPRTSQGVAHENLRVGPFAFFPTLSLTDSVLSPFYTFQVFISSFLFHQVPPVLPAHSPLILPLPHQSFTTCHLSHRHVVLRSFAHNPRTLILRQ